MDQLNEYFRQAELALAAYAGLSAGEPSQAELIKVGMSPTQAQRFSENWLVVDQHTDPASGFSATVFQRGTQKYLAIRGTNSLIDAFVDWGVFAGTGAVDQYRALEAYYQRLLATGKVSGGEQLIVSGHSLGGFLAQGFAVDYPGAVSQTYTYNAPGLGGLVAEIFQALGWVQPNVPLDNIINLRAEPGLSATASLGTVLGNIQPVFIEATLNPLHNHSIVTLTDALAVYNLLATLDPSLNTKLANIGELLKAASNTATNSLEATLSALGKVFGKNYPATETGRDTLYTNLYDLQGATADIPAGALTVRSLTAFNAAQIASVAQNNIAYRYALKNLNPFAILGNDALYAPHNANGELDRYDPATGSGNLSDRYLRDRAEMLAWKMQFDTQDQSYGDDWNSLTTSGDWDFIDHGRLVDGQPLKLAIDGVSFGAPTHQIVFGSEQADAGASALTGGDNADRLYGGGGADELRGGAGNDHLEGQLGGDTLHGEDGRDTLFGGLGGIEVDGALLAGGDYVSPGVWQKNGITYVFTQDANGLGDLFIQSVAGTSIVKHYTNGQLGITLPGAPVPQPAPPPDRTILGDLAPADADPSTVGVQWSYDDIGNLVVDPNTPAPDRVDTLYDSAGNDLIQSLGGNDLIEAFRGGHDRLDGGAGNDIVLGRAGDDLVIGGAGQDLLRGDAGKDKLYATSEVTIQAALGAQDAAPSGLKGDFFDGGDDDDTLVGDIGNDALNGGRGGDLILGGAGDDDINGDLETTAVALDWSIQRSVTANAWGNTQYHNLHAGSDFTKRAGHDSSWKVAA